MMILGDAISRMMELEEKNKEFLAKIDALEKECAYQTKLYTSLAQRRDKEKDQLKEQLNGLKIAYDLCQQVHAQAATPEYPCAGCGGEGKQREGKFFYSCDKCNSSSARDSNG